MGASELVMDPLTFPYSLVVWFDVGRIYFAVHFQNTLEGLSGFCLPLLFCLLSFFFLYCIIDNVSTSECMYL